MSAFLGPVHHWLFNKIKLFGDLETEIIQASEAAGYKDINNYVIILHEKFGAPLPDMPLQDLIDESNIHGWLHTKIGECELRQAALITYIIREHEDGLALIKGVYESQAEKSARTVDTSVISNPDNIYKVLNDFILDGMPCDNVKCVTENTESLLQWKVTNCLHKKYWDKVDGDVNVFYTLREIWISKFVTTLNCGYEFKFKKESIDSTTVLVSEIIKK